MLQNAYLIAKIGADTAENERSFAESLPIGRRVADRCRGLVRRGRLGGEVREVVREEVHGLLVLADLDLGAVQER